MKNSLAISLFILSVLSLGMAKADAQNFQKIDSCAFIQVRHDFMDMGVGKSSFTFKDILDSLGEFPMIRFIGFPDKFRIRKVTYEGYAYAKIHRNSIQRAEIGYDENLLNGMRTLTESDWCWFFVAAHEFSHFSLNHLGMSANFSSRKRELEADKRAAMLLRWFGAPDSVAISLAVKLMAQPIRVNGYPSRRERLDKIQEGWIEADNMFMRSAMLAIERSEKRIYYEVEEDIWIADIGVIDTSVNTAFGISNQKNLSTVRKKKVLKSRLFIEENRLKLKGQGRSEDAVIGFIVNDPYNMNRKIIFDDFMNVWYLYADGIIRNVSNELIAIIPY